MIKGVLFGLGLAVLGLGWFAAPACAGADSPVVVELYTSQGCSSCPPAEAYLRELAKRPDLLALEFHVDYWDYIGWKDPFSSTQYADRQRAYSAALGARYVYTPQIVIQGRTHAVGSKRHEVEEKIAENRTAATAGPDLTLRRDGNAVVVHVGGAKASGQDYDIFFVGFDAKHTTEVLRGENRGMTLVNSHIVRDLERVGHWSGGPVDLTVPLAGKKGDGGCAVLVQAAANGPIVAAAMLPYEGS